MICAGIDIGSRTTKVIILDDNHILCKEIRATGWQPAETAREVFEKALYKAELPNSSVEKIIATGYGRVNLPFADVTLTEITCHGRGAYFLNPNIRTIIDIGGQDSKIIRLDSSGFVEDFAMNDRCAAGTGKFLEFLAHTLEVEVSKFGELALESKSPATVSSMCTVFAESEIISLLAENTPIPDIVAGIHLAISKRIEGLIHLVGYEKTVSLTGGVALNKGIKRALEEVLSTPVLVVHNPEYVGALGAALFAAGI